MKHQFMGVTMRHDQPRGAGPRLPRADLAVALFIALCAVLMLASVPLLFRSPAAAPTVQRSLTTDVRPHLP